MKLKTIDDFDFKGKTVLLRSDLNSEVINNKPIMSPRISESAKTINELKKKGAKVVVLAHQSRPGKKDFISLRKHAKLLSRFTKVKFIPDIIGKKAVSEIINLKNGEALLLENIRILKEEFNPSTKTSLVKVLTNLCDIYINDAFSVSHRKQTSITEFPKVLPSAIGRLMEKELNGIEKLKVKNALFILAGSKKENIKLINKRKKILVGGVFGHLCLSASGKKLGAQENYLKKEFENFPVLKKKLKRKLKNVKMPVDLAVKANGRRKEIPLSEFPSNCEVFDIGKNTIKNYINEIKKAKVILLKGTLGRCEEKQFCLGTKEILNAMANSKAFTVLAGGHTSTALEKLGINKKAFNYISLSGGAFVSYLAGEKLPGLCQEERLSRILLEKNFLA